MANCKLLTANHMRSESLFFLYSSITRIKGVGGATASALQRLLPMATVLDGNAVPTVRDILFHLPVGIIDRRFTCPIASAPDGVVATFVVTVDTHLPPSTTRRNAKSPYKVVCSNETGSLTLVFFHASHDYILQVLPLGSKRVISGRCEYFDYGLQMTHPDIIAPVHKLAEVQKAEAVYPLTVGLTSKRIANIAGDALGRLPDLPEWITPARLAGWPGWKEALTGAHHPETIDDVSPLAPARQRLAYDELLADQLYLGLLRRNMQRQQGEAINGTGLLTGALLASLPFSLTPGQERVLDDIAADLMSGKRMGRLLQGDVGSGKTVVALMAMLRAVEEGRQAALMVPTEIIAQQHYETVSRLVQGLGVGVTLLTGRIKGKAREAVFDDIGTGRAGIVIGTHALFQEQVVFKNLALIVIDEQHRFGVGQRMALSAKGNAPHVLHMTATPIPRSLTLTLYGDMDCSLLTEKPPGRTPIITRVIPLSRYESIMQRMKIALDSGEKAYWICPLIEEKTIEGELELTPEHDIAAAQSRFVEFMARFGDVVGLVHGKMKAPERDEQMRRFYAGEVRLLVATTVVEVGVDVRDATIMIIEKAERFGLSQLHQLRGRVGRGDKPSACVLLYSDKAGEVAQSRLSILRDSEDGFKIAEADLKIRGGGELLGTRQSGLPRFIFTDLLLHEELLAQAREDAREILEADPELTGERGQALRILLQLFGFDCEMNRD
jgi:ATP-dependent DNA helicase RecG